MPFFIEMLCLQAVERARKNVCRHDLPKFHLLETQCNESYSCWCTIDSFSRVLKIVFEFSVSRTSRRRNQTGTRILWFRFWILPERPLPVPPDKGNERSKRDWRQKQISGKIDPLVFWKFFSDFDNAPYSKMASNFVIL